MLLKNRVILLICWMCFFLPDAKAQIDFSYQTIKDTLLSVEIDTSKVMIVQPIDIEVMIPVRHWNETYFAVSVNLLSYVIAYCISRRKHWLYKMSGWTYKYYDPYWKEIKDPLFILDYVEPKIIRSNR